MDSRQSYLRLANDHRKELDNILSLPGERGDEERPTRQSLEQSLIYANAMNQELKGFLQSSRYPGKFDTHTPSNTIEQYSRLQSIGATLVNAKCALDKARSILSSLESAYKEIKNPSTFDEATSQPKQAFQLRKEWEFVNSQREPFEQQFEEWRATVEMAEELVSAMELEDTPEVWSSTVNDSIPDHEKSSREDVATRSDAAAESGALMTSGGTS